MPPQQKSKAAKALAAANSGKGKKKKWSKNKMKEKVDNQVLFSQANFDKMLQEVPKYKTITPSILCDRLKVGGSLARAAIQHLVSEGMIKEVAKHGTQLVYTRTTHTE
eukprot:TRINITY_DN1204_c0_g2_i1.p3 TRINITY_DN1204_c0_g2~~TRINITY_DN1204_c0_g2_i1.p3  ORF type:complete len:108 (-),score=15.31 TRINITY_DN1204_c0_g2_i1:270-593(-)